MIILKTQLTGIQTKADRSLKITMETQELGQVDPLFKMLNLPTIVGMSANEDLTDSEVELLKNTKYGVDDIPNTKSPSKKLREVIYLNWKENNEGFEDSESHYKSKMNQLFEHFQQKLPQ